MYSHTHTHTYTAVSSLAHSPQCSVEAIRQQLCSMCCVLLIATIIIIITGRRERGGKQRPKFVLIRVNTIMGLIWSFARHRCGFITVAGQSPLGCHSTGNTYAQRHSARRRRRNDRCRPCIVALFLYTCFCSAFSSSLINYDCESSREKHNRGLSNHGPQFVPCSSGAVERANNVPMTPANDHDDALNGHSVIYTCNICHNSQMTLHSAAADSTTLVTGMHKQQSFWRNYFQAKSKWTSKGKDTFCVSALKN